MSFFPVPELLPPTLEELPTERDEIGAVRALELELFKERAAVRDASRDVPPLGVVRATEDLHSLVPEDEAAGPVSASSEDEELTEEEEEEEEEEEGVEEEEDEDLLAAGDEQAFLARLTAEIGLRGPLPGIAGDGSLEGTEGGEGEGEGEGEEGGDDDGWLSPSEELP